MTSLGMTSYRGHANESRIPDCFCKRIAFVESCGHTKSALNYCGGCQPNGNVAAYLVLTSRWSVDRFDDRYASRQSEDIEIEGGWDVARGRRRRLIKGD
jgi:hypothetical protein